MAYHAVIKSDQEVTAVEISTMQEMSLSEYREYLRDGLFFIDHHEILRSRPAEYPIATTREQFKELLSYLREIENKIGER